MSSGIIDIQLSSYWLISGLGCPGSFGRSTKSHQERMMDGVWANRLDVNENWTGVNGGPTWTSDQNLQQWETAQCKRMHVWFRICLGPPLATPPWFLQVQTKNTDDFLGHDSKTPLYKRHWNIFCMQRDMNSDVSGEQAWGIAQLAWVWTPGTIGYFKVCLFLERIPPQSPL